MSNRIIIADVAEKASVVAIDVDDAAGSLPTMDHFVKLAQKHQIPNDSFSHFPQLHLDK